MALTGGPGSSPSGFIRELAAPLADASARTAWLDGAGSAWSGVVKRLRDGVILPLEATVTRVAVGHGPTSVRADATGPAKELVRAATRQRADPATLAELVEATAAPRDLVAGNGVVAGPGVGAAPIVAWPWRRVLRTAIRGAITAAVTGKHNEPRGSMGTFAHTTIPIRGGYLLVIPVNHQLELGVAVSTGYDARRTKARDPANRKQHQSDWSRGPPVSRYGYQAMFRRTGE